MFNAKGQEASYTFQVTPSLFYPIGTRIIFEFSRAIAGMFNKAGAVECNQDTVPVYCNLVSERRLEMLLNKPLDNSSYPNHGSNFTIRGVAMPLQLDKYKKISIMLDLD